MYIRVGEDILGIPPFCHKKRTGLEEATEVAHDNVNACEWVCLPPSSATPAMGQPWQLAHSVNMLRMILVWHVF
jgi:hypothetical protein